MKPKFWKDLLTDEPFSRKDLIHLQDPMNLSGRNMEQFDHVKKKLRLISEEEEAKLRVSFVALLSCSSVTRTLRAYSVVDLRCAGYGSNLAMVNAPTCMECRAAHCHLAAHL